MPEKTVWEHINVPLPELSRNANAMLSLSSQDKGSTEWAAHSHTPLGVEVWEEFDSLVIAEGDKHENKRLVNIPFESELQRARLKRVTREEDITENLERILEVYADSNYGISGCMSFAKSSHVLANPDIVAQVEDPSVWGDGGFDDYHSPVKGQKAEARRNVVTEVRALYRYPFETKPWWKFDFLNHTDSHLTIIREWQVPDDFDRYNMRDEKGLPQEWSWKKKKIFHVVRQLYGQMVTDECRYGILHIYKKWFFCARTDEEIFKVSRPFKLNATSPSVFQGIKTMSGFQDYRLASQVIHPSSARKASPKKSKRRKEDEDKDSKPKSSDRIPPSYGGSNPELWSDSRGKTGDRGGASTSLDPENIASSVCLWDCNWFDSTDRIHLLTLKKDPSVVVKLQKNPRADHVARDMEREAKMYLALSENQELQQFMPRFLGYSTHLGVGLTCIEKECDDFDDVGLENLSTNCKRSAVRCVEALTRAGVLHNDIELRNIVRSKDDPNRAKIIDLGRATFSKDGQKLAAQVQDMKELLGVE